MPIQYDPRGYFYDDPDVMSSDDLFALMRKSLAPAPRLVLAKSIAAPKRKPIAPKRPVLIVKSRLLSDHDLLGALSDAVARGLLSGHDALAAERLVHDGKPMPKAVRDVLLRSVGLKG
ncbi:MAG TPA: hypothetical protein VLC92_09635 [Rhodocyclaceae bacterium]|nr:hypothetical protein [Rhodocyclaceae bacterium]